MTTDPDNPDPATNNPDPATNEPATAEAPAEPADPGDGETPPDQTPPEQAPDGELSRARNDAASYRRRLRDTEQQLDQARRQLWQATVAQTGRLVDPDDLPYDGDADQADDRDDQITGQIDTLLQRKPHLGSRRPRRDMGTGQRDRSDGAVLTDILRARS